MATRWQTRASVVGAGLIYFGSVVAWGEGGNVGRRGVEMPPTHFSVIGQARTAYIHPRKWNDLIPWKKISLSCDSSCARIA